MKKRTIEQTGLIPRSILRTFERFRKQLLPGAEMLVIQEFRISRYQVIVSVRCLITLIFVPILVNILSKSFFIKPGVEYLWNQNHNDIFLNSYQENRALSELHQFEEKIYFESFLKPSENISARKELKTNNQIKESLNFAKEIQKETFEIAKTYNLESIEAISNLFADFLSFLSLSVVFVLLKPQIIILKAFLSESL